MKAEAWLSEWNTAGTEFPPLTYDDNNLALAVLIAGEAAVDTIFHEVGGLDVAAKISAIRFGNLALATDNAALHLFRHCFA
jgi:hypothetical protein